MRKDIKIIIIVLVSIGSLFAFFIYKSGIWSPGLYKHAEKYEVNVAIEKLILALNKFKNINHNYVPPLELNINDGVDEEEREMIHPHYHAYLYYEEERELVYFWFRKIDDKNTKVALVAIAKAQTMIGSWKDINKDFEDYENEVQKARFKYRILHRITKLVE